MAPHTVHAEPLGLGVVEQDLAGADGLLRIEMAERATRRSFARLLSLEVAEDARRRGDGDVTPLDDLRVARRAAQRLSAPHLDQMGGVVEEDIADHLLSDQEAPFVAAQARGILDLGPGIGPVRGGEVAGHHGEGLELLVDLRSHAWRDVAVDAGDVLVRGVPPGVVVGLHDVA
jgi:hypothetical protein